MQLNVQVSVQMIVQIIIQVTDNGAICSVETKTLRCFAAASGIASSLALHGDLPGLQIPRLMSRLSSEQ